MKKALEDIYLEWINNYLTIDLLAEHLGITPDEANSLIRAGRSIHRSRS